VTDLVLDLPTGSPGLPKVKHAAALKVVVHSRCNDATMHTSLQNMPSVKWSFPKLL
jgi:hypothetical protein